MTIEEITRRQDLAEELFKQGFNCAQAVTAACADIYGVEQDLALRISASFGGGIGRMRQTCGAACGMFLLAGLQTGSSTPHDAEGKQYNYTIVQQLAEAFKQENGSLICSDLLGLNAGQRTKNEEQRTLNTEQKTQNDAAPNISIFNDPKPEARTETYYKKRPCVEMVRSAVKIYLKALDEM